MCMKSPKYGINYIKFTYKKISLLIAFPRITDILLLNQQRNDIFSIDDFSTNLEKQIESNLTRNLFVLICLLECICRHVLSNLITIYLKTLLEIKISLDFCKILII